MLGLRTQEGEKFERFFALVQNEARKKGCVFFGDAGMGKTFENDVIECEDFCGWLIPKDDAIMFGELFKEASEAVFDYDDFYCYVDFEVDKKTGRITIIIDDTPNDLIVDDFGFIAKDAKIVGA